MGCGSFRTDCVTRSETEKQSVQIHNERGILIEKNDLDISDGLGYPCHKCGKVYKWKTARTSHLKNECGLEPKFKCSYCDYRSKWQHNLKTHIEAFTETVRLVGEYKRLSIIIDTVVSEDGTPRYPCYNCGKTYIKKQYRNSHMKHECGQEPKQQCPYCRYRAKRQHDLKKHIYSKHYSFGL
ncbi:zinc finger X-chromosomal protein-like [Lycorma delicatula]|uniref:zinc finger X-chromosomal protein-like n=1 Tax=Lycorma delicatula TaxID=130591 RepID=UPI003F517D39